MKINTNKCDNISSSKWESVRQFIQLLSTSFHYMHNKKIHRLVIKYKSIAIKGQVDVRPNTNQYRLVYKQRNHFGHAYRIFRFAKTLTVPRIRADPAVGTSTRRCLPAPSSAPTAPNGLRPEAGLQIAATPTSYCQVLLTLIFMDDDPLQQSA